MKLINRREFLGASALLLGACSSLPATRGSRVVVVGGGFGGATAARYLKLFSPQLDVVLVEPAAVFYTCPLSNMVIVGLQPISSIAHNYDKLRKKYGINVIQASAKRVDGEKKIITLADGSELRFDKAIVSPGIDFKFDDMPGYSEAISQRLPHAWKAGAQTTLLQQQLIAMKDGDNVIICPPKEPFRCPPGPYERASLIAYYLKNNKPKSKVLILDRKEKFSKQGLFQPAWEEKYGNRIEWRGSEAGGNVLAVNSANMTVETEFGAEKAGVINFIPQQKAAALASDSGLTDASGWCPVNANGFSSTLVPNVHVIGDASIAGAMPKSGFSANSQGKMAALAVISALNGQPAPSPSWINTCYSLVAPDYGITVSGIYKLVDGKLVAVEGAGGVSPKDASAGFRRAEAEYSRAWYQNITADMFG